MSILVSNLFSKQIAVFIASKVMGIPNVKTEQIETFRAYQ
jgi:hypothetical protein